MGGEGHFRVPVGWNVRCIRPSNRIDLGRSNRTLEVILRRLDRDRPINRGDWPIFKYPVSAILKCPLLGRGAPAAVPQRPVPINWWLRGDHAGATGGAAQALCGLGPEFARGFARNVR